MMMIVENIPWNICLKCHILWEKNQTNFPLGVYGSLNVLSLFVCSSMSCKMCNRFFTIFSWPRWLIDLKNKKSISLVPFSLCESQYVKGYGLKAPQGCWLTNWSWWIASWSCYQRTGQVDSTLTYSLPWPRFGGGRSQTERRCFYK